VDVLALSGVTKRYGPRLVLNGLDLGIERGEVVALLGANGAGKTTLVSIVAGLRPADAGTVTVCGIDVSRDPRSARALIGLAPQDLGVYPPLSVHENLVLFGNIAGLRGRQLAARVDELAEALDLTELLRRQVLVLSGGQKRRLHTAIALVARPPLLLLDEPTVGADVESRSRLLAVMRTLAAEGAAICYTTHYLAEVEELDARVAILHGGRVAADGRVSELTREYGRALVELRFDGPAPRLEGAVADPTDDSILRIPSDEPGVAASSTMAALGGDAARVYSLEIVREGLEAAYRAVTGSGAEEAETQRELSDVAPT
jgi:ABC-2 type transport system ATP-binding protein